jgi:DNA polymerase III alpha subunit (gram-positive type)
MNLFLQSELSNLKKLSSILNYPLVFIDLETTGLIHEYNFSIIEIGLIYITSNKVEEKSALIDPKISIPTHITNITGINNSMVHGKKEFNHFAPYLNRMASESILCGFNSKTFDSKGMEKMLQKLNFNNKFENQLDFRHIYLRARKLKNGIASQSGSLTQASLEYGIKLNGNAHRAAYDIALTAHLAEELLIEVGFGLLHKDIEKMKNLNIKKNFYEFIAKNKIKPIF